ncbi:MAG: T9SS type A sorting domain-containing protein [Bacteroidota bacterium]
MSVAKAQFATLPYQTSFESGTLDIFWTTQTSDALGRVQTWNNGAFAATDAVSGNWCLGLDTQAPGNVFSTNEAWLRINLMGEEDVILEFWWTEWNDETHAQDGIYFSDDGGNTFQKVLDFVGSAETDLEWRKTVLDISELATSNGLSLTNTFVIKFQQFDNFFFDGGNDGFFFDDIRVSSNQCLLDAPTAADVDICGTGSAILTASGSGGQINWFDSPTALAPLVIGSSLGTPELDETTTYYAAVSNTVNYDWNFSSSLDGWTAIEECGLTANSWSWSFDGGNGAAFAVDIAGNSSQFLQSPLIDVGGASFVDLNFEHRFNTEICCDHGYVVYRLDGGGWQVFTPTVGTYNVFDFMYNDPISGACGNSPDMDVFAGDNGGYQTSSGQIEVLNANTLEVGFLFTTDPSFGDEGWYIREVNMDVNCESPRTVVSANVFPNQPSPLTDDATSCDGAPATLSVVSNSSNPSPTFDWFNTPTGGNSINSGSTFTASPLATTTYWVEENPGGAQVDTEWTFDNDQDGWALLTQCSLPFNWNWNSDNGYGSLYATNPTGGSSSMLAISPGVNVSNIDEVNLTFKHRFNTETCCDHGYVVYRLNGGPWQYFEPDAGEYNIYDFMYNDPILGGCGFSPDTLTFAGDSGGYITSSGNIDVNGINGLQVGFLFTSDPSFVDDGWYIDQVRIVSTSNCPSARVPATIYVEDAPPAPSSTDLDICSGFSATLEATSNSANPEPVFNWFNSPAGGSPIFTGDTYIFDPLSPTTVYVEELSSGSQSWTFDNDLEGWSVGSQCDLPSEWEWVDDGGEGAIFAQQTNSGNSSMELRSPVIQIENSEILNLSFNHRYNTETCCDHGYVVYRIDGGDWAYFEPTTGPYNVYDFMYNDPFFGNCGFSPDTLTFAGDSGGYFTSSGNLDVTGGSQLEIIFFFSSDASFVDEGWYINDVTLDGIALPDCVSPRTPVNVNFPTLVAPSTTDVEICPPQVGTLTASTNSGTVDPLFEWYNAASGGNLLFTGSDYSPIAPPINNTTYYAREVISGNKIWDFSNGQQGWITLAQCGLTSNWALVQDGEDDAFFAQQIGSGNSSMSLRSPAINVGQDNGLINLSFVHRYNTEACCDHGYVTYRLDGGPWQFFEPEINDYNIFDFMYNDPNFGGCGFSPDTTVFAGDSNGYIESSGEIDVSNANFIQLQFFYSSDASFVDEGWFISEVRLEDIITTCSSNTSPATLSTSGSIDPPMVDAPELCPGLTGMLTAESVAELPDENSVFTWYDAPAGGNLLFTGNPYTISPISTTTYYVEETSSGNLIYDFDGSTDGWTTIAECGLTSNWENVTDQDRTAMFAQQEGAGNSSMFLQSPVIPLNGQFTISYNFTHRYNTETCCDHGYLVARRDGGPWFQLTPNSNGYNVFDFMYNDPILGGCGFSPDINVYAGDSGGYITSGGLLFVSGFSTVEFGFLYTSDPSFVDDGWYIDQFVVNNIYSGCSSPRIPVTVNVNTLAAPSGTPGTACIGGSALLEASSNSNVLNTTFEWYDAAVGGNLLYVGSPFLTPPINSNQSYWVQEVSQAPLNIFDDFEGGFDPGVWGLVQGGTSDQICGSVAGDALRFFNAGTRSARTNIVDVSGGGSIEFDLKISGELTVGCETAEPGEDVVLEYSIGGPYTIISTYNEASYPDFTNIVEQIPVGAQTSNTIFRLRQLSNSGLNFDVWAIDNFSINGLSSNNCNSSRTQVMASVETLAAPSGTGDDICSGETAVLSASSNSGYSNPFFEWYTSPAGGTLLGVGDEFNPSPATTTTYWLQENNQGNRAWFFTSGLDDWTATAECGLPFNWEWNSDGGVGAVFATNPTGGNSSMLLSSPIISVGGAPSVNFSFSHRYNTETCCDHGYVIYRLDDGPWEIFEPTTNDYNVFDFMYNDPILGSCGFSPDTTVFAGDSGGYITSAGAINTSGVQDLEIAFLFTSDASFVDEGWYINSAQITGLGNGCTSSRSPVTVTVGPPSAPVATAITPCEGGMASLFATATSGNNNPVFEWYDQAIGGNLMHIGNTFETPPVIGPTSYFVQEVIEGIPFNLFDDFDDGPDPSIWGSVQAGQSDVICGSVSGNALRFNGSGSRLAATNQLNVGSGGTISFNLLISNEATAGCEAAEPGENVVLEYSIGGPYTIISTYDQDAFPTFTQVVEAIPEGAESTNTIFRLRQLTNSGLDFDVWAIENFEVDAIGAQLCNSTRAEVQIDPIVLPGPTVNTQPICEGDAANLFAISNTTQGSVEFEWYDAQVGGNLLFTGQNYQPTPAMNTTYYVQEVDPFEKSWTFDSDLEGWLASSGCGLSQNWVWDSDSGSGALFATNPTGGNTSQLVRSGPIDASGTTSVNFSFDHRYNTETCCDHGYAVYRLNNGPWQMFIPTTNTYNVFDFMYNDPILGGCGFSPDTTVYAGDSGGYITSSGDIPTMGANIVEVGFLYTTDASFVDDGWYIDAVSLTDLGDGCITTRTPIDVIVRPCCSPFANLGYTANNTTTILDSYCYIDPTDNFFHLYNSSQPTRLRFSISNVEPSPGMSPVVTIEHVGGPTQNTADPANCDPGPLAPDQYFELERSWDVQLNGGTIGPGGARVRFYYPTIEATDLQDLANDFVLNFAACQYAIDEVEWFKSEDGSMYIQGEYDGTQAQLNTFANATYGTVGLNGIHYVELTAPSFSGGALGVRVIPTGAPLPVELLDFTAEAFNDRTSLLKWRTETEINNDFFAIEHSKDGVDFVEIGQVEGAGTTLIPQNYSFVHDTPVLGDNFYRLRIVDNNGSFTWSPIRVVKFEFEFSLGAMPNPFYENFTVNITSEVERTAVLSVFDILGRLVEKRDVTLIPGNNNFYFDATGSNWAAGVYFVDLKTSQNEKGIIKVVKAE